MKVALRFSIIFIHILLVHSEYDYFFKPTSFKTCDGKNIQEGLPYELQGFTFLYKLFESPVPRLSIIKTFKTDVTSPWPISLFGEKHRNGSWELYARYQIDDACSIINQRVFDKLARLMIGVEKCPIEKGVGV